MHKIKCDVIITYCWNRVGYNILRSLASHGLNVWVADTSKKNICSKSKFCKGSFIYPDYKDDENAFISFIKEKIKELNPKMLLPTHDESVIIMRHRNEFPQELIIPYDNEEILLLLANKAKSTKIAGEIGIPIPKVYNTIEEIDQYPVVFKTTIGNSAKTVFFPKTEDELLNLKNKYKNQDFLIESWIEGTDYSVDCIRWNDFWQSSVYRAVITKTNGGGTTTQREIVNFPELEIYAKKMLDYVKFKGVCGLDFRYNSQKKQIAYIETNVRFTGGLATPICAGFDIPWILYNLAVFGHYDENINIKIGTKTKWILGDFITFVGRLLTFKWNFKELKQIFSFHGFDAYDDYFTDDKKAIIGEFNYYLSKLIKNRKLNP